MPTPRETHAREAIAATLLFPGNVDLLDRLRVAVETLGAATSPTATDATLDAAWAQYHAMKFAFEDAKSLVDAVASSISHATERARAA